MNGNTQGGLYKDMLKIGLPVTLQSMFQASLSVIDQLMVGQLGSVSIAGSGLGGKFVSLFTVTVTALSGAASILIAQYYGAKDRAGVNRSFFFNLYLSFGIMAVFTIASFFLPGQIMGFYTTDAATCAAAAEYLKILSVGFLPFAVTLMLSTLLRSTGYSRLPMYASIVSIVINIAGNYILIFGKLGFPSMGLAGAAIATTFSRYAELAVIALLFYRTRRKGRESLSPRIHLKRDFAFRALGIALPLLVTEFMWSLGENVYAMIYGRLGTDACAAMTLTNSIQAMMVGLFTGVSASAGILIGIRLGRGEKEEAYRDSKRLVRVAFIGSVCISGVIALIAPAYVRLFQVEEPVRQTAVSILYAFAIVLFAKILNMTLAGGILRSGGNTRYTMLIDLFGTWAVGIPLGLVAAYLLHLPIAWVYFILSLEECVRLALALVVFVRKKWMRSLVSDEHAASS